MCHPPFLAGGDTKKEKRKKPFKEKKRERTFLNEFLTFSYLKIL